MWNKRLLEVLAMAMIGDSVLAIVSPRRHVSLWMDGPNWWTSTCKPFVRHPDLTRLAGAAGLALGLWLAWKQEPPLPRPRQQSVSRRVLRRFEEVAR